MTKNIEKLLPQIQNLPIFKEYDFRLIGGTALSYHINHRLSEDLDFCMMGNLPREAIDNFIEYCISIFGVDHVIPIEFTQGKLMDFEINVEDIQDYEQNWMINGVKVTFFNGTSATGIRDIFKEDIVTNIGNIKIASTDSIFKMKSLMFYNRAKSRDYFDLFYLYDYDRDKYSIEKTVALIQKYELAYVGKYFELFIHKIETQTYKKDLDEPLTGLVEVPQEFTTLRDKMLQLLKRVEIK